MVVAAVLDGKGRPVCTEMLPGNTADTTVLVPIVDSLRRASGSVGPRCGLLTGCVSRIPVLLSKTVAAKRRQAYESECS